jgi:hypothetical protein
MTSALKNSQIDHRFDGSTRIWTRGYAYSKQKIKANLLVVSPLLNGHRNIAGGKSERWSSTVTDAGTLQTKIEAMEHMGRTRSSPRCCRACRRGRRWSGRGDRWRPVIGFLSSSALIGVLPARLAWTGGRGSHCGASELVLAAPGCLYRQRLGSPKLGFRQWYRETERERNWRGARVWQRHGASYRPRRAVAQILTRPTIGRLPSSCFPGSGGWRRRCPGWVLPVSSYRTGKLAGPQVGWPAGPRWWASAR